MCYEEKPVKKEGKSAAQVLNSFKKSNKERKEKLAKKAGMTVFDYQVHLVKQADIEAGNAVKAPLEKEIVETSKTSSVEVTDMVIAFDTTGSMASYIKDVKKHVVSLIPTLLAQNPTLKISIVAFGDYCDMPSTQNFGNAYQVIGLTRDEQCLIDFVRDARGTGGGDEDEFYELVIKKICEETAWRPGSLRSVLLIADSDPHPVGYSYSNKVQNSQIDWREEARKAQKLEIRFDTLTCKQGHPWYKELSDMTEGLCLPFSSSNKTADLIQATSLARGGAVTRDAFYEKSMSSSVIEDKELNSVYSMYKTFVDESK